MDDRPQFDRTDSPRGGLSVVQDIFDTTTDSIHSDTERQAGQQIIDKLHVAAFSDQNSDLFGLIETYLSEGITAVDLCETYIPEVARRLGAQWCDDTLSFAGVTIGCARLIKALRVLEAHEAQTEALDAPQILLLVSEDVYHTLGATVLSGMLRRAGLGVQLWVGATADALTDRLRHTDFDAIFLSASMGESVESLSRLVAAAKLERSDMLTIVGGTIIQAIGSAKDVARMTGADVATIDIERAIKLCREAAKVVRPIRRAPRSKTNSVTRLQVR